MYRTQIFLVLSGLCLTMPIVAAPRPVRTPLNCSRGDADTAYSADITMPETAPTGGTLSVRIDSRSSGRISHLGLNYIHDMMTEYLLPAGLRLVEGSPRIVPETGTPNARAGARTWHDGSRLFFALPAHIANGETYTPPSLEFTARIDAPAGSHLPLELTRYELVANAILVGDVHTHCEPAQKPFRIAMVHVADANLP